MNEPQQYTLKHPMTVESYDDGDLYIVDGEVILGSDECKHLFAPVGSVDNLQQFSKYHIADAISGALELGHDPTDAVWQVLEESGVVALIEGQQK
jgi:hypothetical protein